MYPLKKNQVIYESYSQKLYTRGARQVKSRLCEIVIWAKYVNILSDTDARYIYMEKYSCMWNGLARYFLIHT